MPSDAHGRQTATGRRAQVHGLDLLRPPDLIHARFSARDMLAMQYSARQWTCPRVRVSTEPVSQGSRRELPIRIATDGRAPTHLHLRWKGRQSEALLSIGDHWERSYGDLEWRGTLPERMMPWYFLTFDGVHVNGYGVKTQPSAFCFWQRDADGISLTIDLRNGGEPVELGSRELQACTVTMRMGQPEEPISHAAREFCKAMCSEPRLPKRPVFGVNDWNYAYGKNTAAGILRDADLVASLAPPGDIRPHVVIDDGWQDPARFPSMADLASQIRNRGLQPGLWIRPLRAEGRSPQTWLLPDVRFGKGSPHNNLALDPTVPDALNQAMQSVRHAVDWGYGFIKHDFSTWELFGRWGFAMRAEITSPGWHFSDRSRTNAEVLKDFYRAIRSTAGQDTTILGCNTVGHLAAGIFESQRIADDTSGHDWERTRRFGVNGLAHRISQHRTFFHIDPDCVAITPQVGWRETSLWMDVVARSGTSLFFSPEPGSVTPETKSAMRDAMLAASQPGEGYPAHPTSGTTPNQWQFLSATKVEKTYDWCGSDGVTPFDV